jgi:hypothetical protein
MAELLVGLQRSRLIVYAPNNGFFPSIVPTDNFALFDRFLRLIDRDVAALDDVEPPIEHEAGMTVADHAAKKIGGASADLNWSQHARVEPAHGK